VGPRLIAVRRNVLTFYSLPEESVQLFREHKVALLFANYGTQQVQQLKKAGADIGYTIPKEGALAWLDCWTVTRGAKNKLLAEATWTASSPSTTRTAMAWATSRWCKQRDF
jgi:putative spermidine/putrescine transport system substrate-binding protein